LILFFPFFSTDAKGRSHLFSLQCLVGDLELGLEHITCKRRRQVDKSSTGSIYVLADTHWK